MIAIVYKELFEIMLLHDFYTSGQCTDLQLEPTVACLQTLQLLGIRFLPTATGGKLLARTDKSGPATNPVYTIQNPVPENTRFTFLLTLKKSTFETFTQTKLDRAADQYYYFNNIGTNMSTDGLPLLVASKTAKKVADADLITVKRNAYTFVHNSTAPTQSGELRQVDNDEVLVQERSNNNDTFSFQFDLARLTGGRTSFSVDGVKKETFYNLPTGESTAFFGLVDIFHRAALTPNYRFQQANNTITSRLYAIPFAARATRWRYVIAQKFNPAITGVSVQKINGETINFSAQTGSPTGQYIIASESAVPLREQPVTGIQLKDQANNVLIPHLPNPSFAYLKKEGADLFSEVYITI
jgi:hypothetical protein